MRIDFDLPRSDVENLLSGFLTGAQGVELCTRLTELRELPIACRTHVQVAETSGAVWVAWTTPSGPVVAWGNIDVRGSRQMNGRLLLFVEWCAALSGHHSLWTHCDPKRPTE